MFTHVHHTYALICALIAGDVLLVALLCRFAPFYEDLKATRRVKQWLELQSKLREPNKADDQS